MFPTRRMTVKTTARCSSAEDSQTALEAASSPGSTGRAPADPAASVEAQRYRSAPGWNAANPTVPRSERRKPRSTVLASYTERYKPLTIQHVPACSTYLIGDWKEKNFSGVKCLLLNEKRRGDFFLFSVVGEGESSYSWKMEIILFLVCGERGRILVVALVGREESFLSVQDRREFF